MPGSLMVMVESFNALQMDVVRPDDLCEKGIVMKKP
jgi:hypothetical protein